MEISSLSSKVKIVEVGPRDGLQNEKKIIPTELKLNFIKKLIDSGVQNIEATSFVSPKAIPQMADSLELFSSLKDLSANFSVFVANQRGAENAKASGVKEVSVFTTTSELFARKNVNTDIFDTLKRVELIKSTLGNEVKIRGYISTVYGCPYEGLTSETKVLELVEKLKNLGCYEISLGDTIGIGSPSQVRRILKAIKNNFGLRGIAVHFHDTMGLGIANCQVALEEGVGIFDSSAAGLGGCPYAKGASGNIATEDLCHLLNKEGIDHGINLHKLYESSLEILSFMGRSSNSKMNVFLEKNKG